jgi:penicillin-binding protein 2
MLNKIKNAFKRKSLKSRTKDIEPDEIFLDSENLPKFNTDQFEGRIEKSISSRTFIFFGFGCLVILGIFFSRSWMLQIRDGDKYLARSENNRLKNTLVFANRGLIYDRNDKKLAWNVASADSPEFSLRKYLNETGLATVIGYIKYPSKDKYGFYYNEDFVGKNGVEQFYDGIIGGENGLRIVEIDAKGDLQSESVVRNPVDGKDIKLSIDSDLEHYLYETISGLASRVGFTGGAGVIMDVNTGEVIAMTSYPEYDSQILTDGKDAAAINKMLTNKNNPFLDRVIDGLYAPGSIVKPYMSIAALSENIIDPATKILSTGSISIPNPYDPEHPTVFKDWKAHGYVDMRHALAVSSDVYFYEVGGGYQNQKGLGIKLIDKYMTMFGFGNYMPEGFFEGSKGSIPTPEWKKENFNGEDWRIGDTYHTSIGQYGFQVTPIQAVRAVASIANGGKLIEPSILFGGNPTKYTDLNFNEENMKVVRDGMRLGVTEGVATGLYVPYVKIAAKTGTAELGSQKQFVNSWVTGFFPYDDPKYAFAVIMEKGPVTNTTGGVYIMRQVFDWMNVNKPEYLK